MWANVEGTQGARAEAYGLGSLVLWGDILGAASTGTWISEFRGGSWMSLANTSISDLIRWYL